MTCGSCGGNFLTLPSESVSFGGVETSFHLEVCMGCGTLASSATESMSMPMPLAMMPDGPLAVHGEVVFEVGPAPASTRA